MMVLNFDNETAVLFLSMASAVAAGIWFAATQVSALNNLSRRLDELQKQAVARYAEHDLEIRQRDLAIAAEDTRLARIEAQLDFLIGKSRPDPGAHTGD